MAGYLEIFCGLIALTLALYYYFIASFDFWKKRGIPGPRPLPIVGNIKDVIFSVMPMGHFLKTVYDEYKGEPMVGIFARRTPVLVLNDPDLIKDVLIKDFSKFVSRGITIFEKAEPLSQHLFNLEPERWRPLRTKLSPIFTSGKMKEMFSLILTCSDHLEKYLNRLVANGGPIECRELSAKYTTDVIGCCAFGIEMNALSEKESEFRKMGKKIFSTDFFNLMRFKMRNSVPWLYYCLGYVLPPTDYTRFFQNIAMEAMDYRKEHNIVRQDFINILLELRNHPEKVGNINLTDNLLAAQAFVFFAAGFETSSSTMSNALYELALNQDIQDKLREEIKEEYAKNGGSLIYENVKQMPYLDKVFRETLRKYPIVTVLMRQSMCNYTFEGTKVSVPKGQKVWIPAYAIHHDPSIYPNPEIFDPERFSDDVAATRHPMQYLPFGDGPRNCIGARFAVYQTKIGLIKVLKNFKVDVSEKTQIPYLIDPSAFLLSPKTGIYLKVSKIE